MAAELPSEDDNSEVLEKLDALMRRHHQPAPPPAKPAAPPPAILAPTLPQAAPRDADDGIPTLTDVVESDRRAVAGDPDSTLRSLEERLQHELETRIAPQLSLAFQQALDELLQDAKRQISITVREHLEQEMHAQRALHRDTP